MELLGLFIIFPAGAVIIGIAFVVVAYLRRKLIPAVVGGIWLLYGVYESLMYARVLCTGECNIRVDLLLIFPVLVVATIAGIVSSIRKGRNSRR